VEAVDLSRVMYRERGDVAPVEYKKRPNFITDSSNKNGKRFKGNSSEYMKKEWVDCTKCGKKHPGECKIGSNMCFKCGKTGHLARDCPTIFKCFNCGERGHMSRECPKPRKAEAVTAPGRLKLEPMLLLRTRPERGRMLLQVRFLLTMSMLLYYLILVLRSALYLLLLVCHGI
jgi:hypothetical protein